MAIRAEKAKFEIRGKQKNMANSAKPVKKGKTLGAKKLEKKTTLSQLRPMTRF
jgi:hypothetical protein